jgi:serine phosphatase RsbU (regulator of sigma subunit)/anti-sigma regulatory factor (Ser/Thr protein kinase)
MSESPEKSTRSITLRLTLNCDLVEVRPATLALRGFLADHGVPGEELLACELALAEACNNAINYSEAEGRSQRINVEANCGLTEIELRVTDHTSGFDWPEQAELPDVTSERGRGLFLIQALMDSTTYLRGRGENCLIMRKSRSPRGDRFPPDAPVNLEDLTRKLAENERIITDMAEELCSCYESFSAIFRYSSDQKRAVGLGEFARQLLDDLVQITSADWYLLRLVPPGASELRVFAASDPSLVLPPLPVYGSALKHGSLEVEAAIQRRDVWFEHKGFSSAPEPLAVAKGVSTGFIHPIIFGDTLIGSLAVGKAGLQNPLTAAKINVVHTFADFLAIQIVNSRIQEERVNALLVARDLEIAKDIQRSLLLKTLPQLPGFSLAGNCESARQVGGDFYDVIQLSDASLLLVIADVMGKGIPAAMFAAIMRSLVRALPDLARQPSDLLSRLNLLLFDELSEVDMFITAQLAFVDAAERRLVAASAGHCPMLMTVGDGTQVKAISPEGMPLGILPDASFGDEIAHLEGDCRLLLYTDGLTEARDTQGELFGQERLIEWLKQNRSGRPTADELKEQLVTELGRFQGNMALNDDQTFLILTR